MFESLITARHKPVIGVSGATADSSSVRAMMTQIAASGGTPLFLSNHAKRDAAADIEKIDALVVMGNGADIDNERYGQPKHPRTIPESDTPEGAARAAYEYDIMQRALEMKMPVLGICGGHQRLNVLLGGTLHQHIPDLVGHDEHAQQDFNIAPFIPVQPVHLNPNSTLARLGESIFTQFLPMHRQYDYGENSMHHQAVARLGDGLRVAATAEDSLPDGSKLIEAIEADPNGPLAGQCVLGVQWHPEFSASELGPRITAHIVGEAEKFASRENRQHVAAQAEIENRFSAAPVVKLPGNGSQSRPGSWVGRVLDERAKDTGSPAATPAA